MLKSRAVRTIVIVLLPALAAAARRDSRPELIYRPVSVSLIPPLSTNWLSAGRVRSNLSLNILGGRLGMLEGVELGGLFNSVRYRVTGAQAAFGASTCGGDVNGAQLAFGAAVAGGTVRGAQLAFGAAVAGEDLFGAQLAFGAAVAGRDVNGAQLSSGVNSCGRDLTGIQLGPVNICKRRNLAQVGFVNIAGTDRFAQVGFVNVADRATGAQLGFVNIAEESDWSFGLVSIAGRGRFDVCLEASEAPLGALSLKAGTRRVYNVFTLGWAPGDSARLAAGLGIGLHFPADRWFFDVDATVQSVFTGPEWFGKDADLGVLTRVRPTAGFRFARWLAVYAGPNLAAWRSDDEDGSRVALYDLPLAAGADPYYRLWPGFTVGLQVSPDAAGR